MNRADEIIRKLRYEYPNPIPAPKADSDQEDDPNSYCVEGALSLAYLRDNHPQRSRFPNAVSTVMVAIKAVTGETPAFRGVRDIQDTYWHRLASSTADYNDKGDFKSAWSCLHDLLHEIEAYYDGGETA